MFWTEDITLLWKPILIPTDYMSFDEKMNALTRLVIFICLITGLVIQDINVILFMIIIMVAIVVIYKYNEKTQTEITEEFFNRNELDIVNNSICVKPTDDNPMMNPDLTNIRDYEKYNISGACPSYTDHIADKIDEIFDKSSFINSTDIYNTSLLKRQFYTVPGNKVPNEQNKFANWLYNRGPSCKENNEERCYSNMYRDIRL